MRLDNKRERFLVSPPPQKPHTPKGAGRFGARGFLATGARGGAQGFMMRGKVARARREGNTGFLGEKEKGESVLGLWARGEGDRK